MKEDITLGDSDSLSVSASEGFLQYNRTEVVSGTLRVYVDENADISRLTGEGIFEMVPLPTDIIASGASIVQAYGLQTLTATANLCFNVGPTGTAKRVRGLRSKKGRIVHL